MENSFDEEYVIRMFAALQTAPVIVSYPDGQMAKTDINIRPYMWDHDFITYYKFGPYQLRYCEVSRYKQNTKGNSDEMEFSQPGTNMHIPVLVKKNPVGVNRNFIALSNAIMAKADGKPFENLYANAIKDGIGVLLYCLNDNNKLSTDKIASFTTKLNDFQNLLLMTQNITPDTQRIVNSKSVKKTEVIPKVDALVHYVENIPDDMLREKKAQSIIKQIETIRAKVLQQKCAGGRQRGARKQTKD